MIGVARRQRSFCSAWSETIEAELTAKVLSRDRIVQR
jgi:hypothetical protein